MCNMGPLYMILQFNSLNRGDRRSVKSVHNREKSLRHFAMVVHGSKFFGLQETETHLKREFALFQISSILFNFI